jgi:hypothetical protein
MRQTGKTTRQMQALPTGAVFVWVSNNLDYPKALARHLRRDDLQVVGPGWLTSGAWHGVELAGLDLDHAAALDGRQLEHYRKASERVQPAHALAAEADDEPGFLEETP